MNSQVQPQFPHTYKFFNRFPQTWLDFYALHPFLVNTSAALTFLGFLAYGVYRYFFGKKRGSASNSDSRRRDSASSSECDEDISKRGNQGRNGSKLLIRRNSSNNNVRGQDEN